MILRLPLPGTFLALTLHPRLLILSRRLDRLEPWQRTMVYGHEHVHAEQMLRDGWLRFVCRYLFTGEWRARYEMEANRVNLTANVANGFGYEETVDMLIRKVQRAYFPRWWFGRAPSAEAMREMLLA